MKYEYSKALNELKKRGVKVPKALGYNEMLSKLNSTFAQMKHNYKGKINFQKAGSVIEALNSKNITGASKRSLLSKVGAMHDEQNLSYKDIVTRFSKITIVPGHENDKDVLKFSKNALTSIKRTDKNLKLQREMQLKSPKAIVNAAQRRLSQQSGRFKDENINSMADYYLNKSLGHLTGDLRTCVDIAIKVNGASYYTSKMQLEMANWRNESSQHLIAVLLSSDENQMYTQHGLFDDFFEFDKVYNKINDKEIVNGLTKKQINDLFSKYGFASQVIDPSEFSNENVQDYINEHGDDFLFGGH